MSNLSPALLTIYKDQQLERDSLRLMLNSVEVTHPQSKERIYVKPHFEFAPGNYCYSGLEFCQFALYFHFSNHVQIKLMFELSC